MELTYHPGGGGVSHLPPVTCCSCSAVHTCSGTFASFSLGRTLYRGGNARRTANASSGARANFEYSGRNVRAVLSSRAFREMESCSVVSCQCFTVCGRRL